MKSLRVGVIGAGMMGRHHARVYSEIPFADLVGVADSNGEKAREVAAEFKTRAFTDFGDLLEEDLDAVSIAVPTSMHKDVALRVADYGVNMLIEKPIADSIENARRIVKAARINDLKVMIGHIERFNPAVLKLKELIKNGELGSILAISCKRVGPYSPRIRDVGIIIDLAVHEIDTISFLYGMRADNVYAVAGNSFHKWEDYASIVVKFSPDRVGLIDTNWLTPTKVRTLNAVGTGCVANLNYLEQSLEIVREDGKVAVNVRKREPLRNELETFLNCILTDTEPEPSAEDGLYVLSVAISAIKSYKSGLPVEIGGIIV
ncbi:Gfo/Idh/MocA family protein [Archaeoglobus neptunius]|uniref:Gfo/Idh/MocA family protein n=1 Tax=Archaeoglobus neptunius TaxID=2798580 RepID=UPI0019283780|nr:Gfo/Idh/MocA family oxidoreductase [Archaeoglobus neptunius]